LKLAGVADIQSATAEIRRVKKKEEEETTGQNIMVCPSYSIGDHNNLAHVFYD